MLKQPERGILEDSVSQARYPVWEEIRQVHPLGKLSEEELDQIRTRVIVEEAERQGVPPEIALGVSRGENTRGLPWAVGQMGEIGLFQLDPEKHLPAFSALIGSSDMTDPANNARFGVALLKSLRMRHKNWMEAIQAYNGSLGTARGLQYLAAISGQIVRENVQRKHAALFARFSAKKDMPPDTLYAIVGAIENARAEEYQRVVQLLREK